MGFDHELYAALFTNFDEEFGQSRLGKRMQVNFRLLEMIVQPFEQKGYYSTGKTCDMPIPTSRILHATPSRCTISS